MTTTIGSNSSTTEQHPYQYQFGGNLVSDIHTRNRFSLVALYVDINGNGAGANNGPGGQYWNHWLSSKNECEWEGIECEAENVDVENTTRRVIRIERNDIAKLECDHRPPSTLQGVLSESCTHHVDSVRLRKNLFALHWLESLSLRNSLIALQIPPSSIGELTALTHLDLSRNDVSGSIPYGISNLRYLQRLDLSHNRLTGAIPYELVTHSLEYIDLTGNALNGEITDDLCDMLYFTEIHADCDLCVSDCCANCPS